MPKAPLRYVAILIAAAGLSACVHAVDLVPLDGGAPGAGAVGYRGRDMAVRLDGKTYKGAFVSAAAPQITAGLTSAAYGSIPTGRHFGVLNAQGPQGAVLTAKDGATITCRFDYEHSVSIGSGVCRDRGGRNFSLRMR